MSKPLVLLLGQYSNEHRSNIAKSVETLFLEGPQAVAELDSASRARVEAVALKGHAPFGAEQMDLLPALRIVANFGVGYDSIDIAAANARRVFVTNTPEVLNDDVADLAVGMYLSLKRRIPEADAWVRSGHWAERGSFPLQEKASGVCVGILGLGRVGQEIAQRMAAFKSDIHYQSRHEKAVPQEWTYHLDALSLASAVDVLFVTLVGGRETHGLVSDEVLAALGPHGMVINVSRGSVIDEEALIRQLQNGRLGGAALDVFLDEPRPDARFRDLANVLLQPHQGSATHETRAAMATLQWQNIEAYLEGQPLPSVVNSAQPLEG